MGRVECHYVFRALLGPAHECGDIGIVREYGNHCFLGLIDALGHGKSAYEVACRACEYLDANYREDLVATMQGLHGHLKGTKGGVAALCRLDTDSGDLCHVGVGNITVKIMGPRATSFVPRDGVIGYIIPTPTEQCHRLQPGDTLVMYSDGIKEHFNPLDYAGLFSGSAETIATGLLRQLGKKDDDASCIALRYYSI
jgi:hypothetical protein